LPLQAQAKGVDQLVSLAHRWRLRPLDEESGWRPAGRALVTNAAALLTGCGAVPARGEGDSGEAAAGG